MSKYTANGKFGDGSTHIKVKGYDVTSGKFTDSLTLKESAKYIQDNADADVRWWGFTEIEDKNGQEIFEGCIVNTPLGIGMVKFVSSNCITCGGYRVELERIPTGGKGIDVDGNVVDDITNIIKSSIDDGIFKHIHGEELEIVGHFETDKHLFRFNHEFYE